MTYTFKLSRRLAVSRFGAAGALLLAAACSGGDATGGLAPNDPASGNDITAVVVAPQERTTAINEPAQFVAYGRTTQGDSLPLASDVEWSASGGAISSQGVFTASAPGTYRLIARDRRRSKSDTSTVVVTPPAVTMTALRIAPDAASLDAGAKQQFSATATYSDGTTGSPAVTWSATGGTIDANGLYTAGSIAGNYRVIGKSANGPADTSTVSVTVTQSPPPPPPPSPPPSTGVQPWFVEDYSSYATIDDYLKYSSSGMYRDQGENPGDMSLDAANAYGGSPHSLRYDFPQGSPSSGGCNDYGVGRDLYLPSPASEVWIEFYVKYSSNWHTKAPDSWNCTRAADHKLMRGYTKTSDPTYTIFGIKDGHYGWAWTSSGPTADHWEYDAADSRDSYNNQWVRVRLHWKVGAAPNYGVVQVWINDKMIDNYTTMDTKASSIYMLRIGANMNNLVENAQSYWWGAIKVWNNNPGW